MKHCRYCKTPLPPTHRQGRPRKVCRAPECVKAGAKMKPRPRKPIEPLSPEQTATFLAILSRGY